MSDQFENKPLETFFHQYLDQYGEEPSEEFWERLEPQIPPPPGKKRRFLLWWFLLGAVVLFFLISYLSYNLKQLQKLENRVEIQQERIDQMESNGVDEPDSGYGIYKNTGKASPSEKETEPVEEEKEQSLAPQSVEETIEHKKTMGLKKASTAEAGNLSLKMDTSPAPPEISSLPDTVVRESEPVLPEKEEPTEKVGQLDLDQGGALDHLPGKAIFAEYHGTRKLPDFSLQPPRKFLPLFDLGIFYENWLESTVNVPSDLDLETTASGNNWGLRLGIHLNRHWQLQTGLGWTRIAMENTLGAGFDYSMVNAWDGPDNTIFNSYPYRFESPLGSTAYDFAIGFRLRPNQEENPRPGDPFSIEITEREQLDYLYIPLLLEYRSAPDKWQWSAGAGLDFYQLLKVDVAATLTPRPFREEERIVIDEVVISPDSRLEGLRDGFLGAQCFAGVRYHLLPRWPVHFQAAYHFGIGRVTDQQRLYYLGLRLGTTYQF